MKLYGSLDNRLEENRQFCEEIKVGTGCTFYGYSDRHAFEVVRVDSQKRVFVRELAHKLKGGAYSNDWELTSDESAPVVELAKRGTYWYSVARVTREDVEQAEQNTEKRLSLLCWAINNGIDLEKAKASGEVVKYNRENVSFGVADYYYDYSF